MNLTRHPLLQKSTVDALRSLHVGKFARCSKLLLRISLLWTWRIVKTDIIHILHFSLCCKSSRLRNRIATQTYLSAKSPNSWFLTVLRYILTFANSWIVYLKLKADFQWAALMLFIQRLVNMRMLLIWKHEQSARIRQLLMWGCAQGRGPGWAPNAIVSPLYKQQKLHGQELCSGLQLLVIRTRVFVQRCFRCRQPLTRVAAPVTEARKQVLLHKMGSVADMTLNCRLG